MSFYTIFVHVPTSHLEQVKRAMFEAGAGSIGNYSCCVWQVKGEGQFMPEEGSNSYCGEVGKLERVEEYKVETICSKGHIKEVIAAMKRAHPYEMPAYGVMKLEEI